MKLAVVFPGIGYHTGKPLLYYAIELAHSHGYEIREVSYGVLPQNSKGNAGSMQEASEIALRHAEEILKDVDFGKYDKILFLSKSIGTVVAAAYAGKHGLNVDNIYFTPVEAAFPFMKGNGIVFHGTADSYADTQQVVNICKERGLSLHLTEGAGHSLEVGEVDRDVAELGRIMKLCGEYLDGVSRKRITVAAAIIRNGNEIFATQRGHGEFRDGWEFPGGKVEPGETPAQALVREIREELDTEIEVGELADTVEYDYLQFHLTMYCFWCTVKAGDLVLREHKAAKWLTRETLDSVDWLPADVDLIRKIKEDLI